MKLAERLQRARAIRTEREGIAAMLRSLGDRIKAMQAECTHPEQSPLHTEDCEFCGIDMIPIWAGVNR